MSSITNKPPTLSSEQRRKKRADELRKELSILIKEQLGRDIPPRSITNTVANPIIGIRFECDPEFDYPKVSIAVISVQDREKVSQAIKSNFLNVKLDEKDVEEETSPPTALTKKRKRAVSLTPSKAERPENDSMATIAIPESYLGVQTTSAYRILKEDRDRLQEENTKLKKLISTLQNEIVELQGDKEWGFQRSKSRDIPEGTLKGALEENENLKMALAA